VIDYEISLKHTSLQYTWEVKVQTKDPEEAVKKLKEVDIALCRILGVEKHKPRFRIVDPQKGK